MVCINRIRHRVFSYPLVYKYSRQTPRLSRKYQDVLLDLHRIMLRSRKLLINVWHHHLLIHSGNDGSYVPVFLLQQIDALDLHLHVWMGIRLLWMGTVLEHFHDKRSLKSHRSLYTSVRLLLEFLYLINFLYVELCESLYHVLLLHIHHLSNPLLTAPSYVKLCVIQLLVVTCGTECW